MSESCESSTKKKSPSPFGLCTTDNSYFDWTRTVRFDGQKYSVIRLAHAVRAWMSVSSDDENWVASVSHWPTSQPSENVVNNDRLVTLYRTDQQGDTCTTYLHTYLVL